MLLQLAFWAVALIVTLAVPDESPVAMADAVEVVPTAAPPAEASITAGTFTVSFCTCEHATRKWPGQLPSMVQSSEHPPTIRSRLHHWESQTWISNRAGD